MSSSSGRWLGFHLQLRAPHEPFLADHLAPWLEREVEARRVRRFFFIRYGRDGGHLRVRLLPTPGTQEAALRAALESTVCGYLEKNSGAAAADPWLEEQPYSRSVHYFGENRASVYAELLNEATSWLCLRIVRGPGGDRWVCRWLVLIATLHQLVRGTSLDDGDFAYLVEEGRAFARQGWESLGLSIVDEALLDDQPLLLGAARAALARGAAAAGDPLVRHTVRLLRRTRRYAPHGGHVATHALHLLCNKLGFSFYEEYNLFTALRRLAPPSGERQAPQPIAEAV
jgi:thiopeptide-type bacteriocin biosynthesis protein